MRFTIVTKLVFWFLIVAMTPLVIVGYVTYRTAVTAMRGEIHNNLETVAEDRAKQIEDFFAERTREADRLSRDPDVADALEKLTSAYALGRIDSPEYRAADEHNRQHLLPFWEGSAYHDILLISPAGDVVFTLARENDLGTNLRTGPHRDSVLAEVFTTVQTTGETELSHYRYYAPSDTAAAFITTLVRRNGEAKGVLAVQLRTNAIDALARNYSGLGETGEIVLTYTQKKGIFFITPTRHDAAAAFSREVVIGSEAAVPAQEASQGRNGYGQFKDYRGVPVLAAWRYLPELRIAMVVKIDEAEAFAPIRRLTIWWLVLGVCTLLGVVALALLIARSISKPIVALTRTTAQMSGGDMSARAEVRTDDEIGALGGAFNDMVDRLEENREETERQDWLKAGRADLEEQMRGDMTVEALCDNVVTYIANYLGAQVGAFYVRDADGSYRLVSSYAYKKRKNLSNLFKVGEGLVGQAALEKQPIILTDVPDDYVRVTSGLGEKPPKNIVVVPLIFNDEVTAVLEIGSFAEFSELRLRLLEEASEAVAIVLSSAESRVELARALELTQKQAQDLETRQEELRSANEDLEAQQEELRSANEELEEQTVRLRQSEAQLTSQQEELQVTNEELEQKNDYLEKQRREIEIANRELERTGKEIEEKASELALASKYKSEFLANMSHELRTPLNSLLLLAAMLKENKEGNLTDEQLESTTVIHRSGADLLSLINEILDLSKIEAGRMALELGEISPRDLASRARASFQHMAEEKGVNLEVVADEALPDTLYTDHKRVEQIIRNLTSNAIKFTEKGSIGIEIRRPAEGEELRTTGLDPNEAFAVVVRDTGIGIPADRLRVIFEAFQQVEGSAARRYGGTGLGLSITRELVSLLGGEIQLQSEEGRGSTFAVFLPLRYTGARPNAPAARIGTARPHVGARPVAAAKDAARSPEPPASIPDDRDDLEAGDSVILVIEDDLAFAKILLQSCHEKGFKCLVATTGEQGIELAQKFDPKGIALDIRLPGVDGWTVLDALKEGMTTRHIPVHIISVEEPDRDALNRGAVGYLTKPVDREGIEGAFARLEEVFSRKVKELLVVEDDEATRIAIRRLVGNGDVTTTEASTGAEAIQTLRSRQFDCVILDLALPDATGFDLLRTLEETEGMSIPPIIVYTGKELTHDEEMELMRYSESIIVKGVRSEERLLDEVSFFLHRVVQRMPEKKRRMIADLHETDCMFRDKRVLIVDDDMRNVFALSRVLEEKGVAVLKAENGQKALETLEREPPVNLVLMDIMMPVMDGHDTMRRIRAWDKLRTLPIIALTAKAMAKDKDECLAAGASDYLPKPVDLDRLLSMMRVWLYR